MENLTPPKPRAFSPELVRNLVQYGEHLHRTYAHLMGTSEELPPTQLPKSITMIDKSTTNAVRQILMNELGLTREVIREEMRKLIEVEVSKATSAMIANGHLTKLVSSCFRQAVLSNNWSPESLRGLVLNAASRQAEAFIKANLRISTEGLQGEEDETAG